MDPNINIIKTAVVWAMAKEGFITNEQAEKFDTSYAVILGSKNIFHRAYEKLFPDRKKENIQYYDVVKFIPWTSSLKEDTKEDELDGDDVAQLQFELIKAEKAEDYELAKKIKEKINKLKNK